MGSGSGYGLALARRRGGDDGAIGGTTQSPDAERAMACTMAASYRASSSSIASALCPSSSSLSR